MIIQHCSAKLRVSKSYEVKREIPTSKRRAYCGAHALEKEKQSEGVRQSLESHQIHDENRP